MTTPTADISPRKAAKIAGYGFLVSFVGAILTTLFVDNLIVPGDAATTASNIMASGLPFRIGIVSWLIVIIGDVVRAWALYVFFKQVSKSLALLAAWFMLIHVAILGIAILNLLLGTTLLGGADYSTALGTGQVYALVLLFLNGYRHGFLIGLFFFSLHLGILGYLVYRSGFVPRILSILLIVASSGYLVNSVGRILFPNYPEMIWTVLAVPCFIGESALIVWLVFRGGKGPRRIEHALQSA